MIKKIIKFRFLSLIIALISLSMVYFGGSFLSSTQYEKIAEYATDIVVNHTENRKYCAITVQASEDSGAIPDSTIEFHQLYGIFRQQKVTFASGMNIDKSLDISLGDGISDNLSVLYVGPVGTTEYNGHYKHYVSPIEVMFPDERNYDVNKYVVYISKSHADRLLDLNHHFERNENGEYNIDDYRSLVKTNISIYINGTEHLVLIQNIYYQSNYYYKGLNDVMGDFVISSYYFPQNLRSKQQNIYFLSEYTYQNKFFMDYINSTYSSKKYVVRINHYNIIGDIYDDRILSFYYSNQITKFDSLAIFIFIFSGILLFISLLMHIYQNFKIRKLNYLWTSLNLCFLFVPYIIFRAIYYVSGNISFLSTTSGKVNIWFVVAYVILLIVLPLLFNIKINKIGNKNKEPYEINI